MKNPACLRPVADPRRPGRGTGTTRGRTDARAPNGEGTRPAPWLSFNATELPGPLAESAPAFGPNRFLLGANLPWVRYGLDYGSSAATPQGGLHADASAAGLLDAALARLRRDGVQHARVFVFCDGRAGIRLAPDGTPEGLDGSVFSDVDVLLAAAERHRLGLLLVLFDAGLVAAPSVVDGVSGGGHGALLADAEKRQALLERVLVPLLAHYGEHPAIDGWDVFDEPECVTSGMRNPEPPAPRRRPRLLRKLGGSVSRVGRRLGLGGGDAPGPALIEAEAMRAFLGAAVNAVHRHTRALATVGLASTANLQLVQGLGLDFYQVHWWEPYGDARLRQAVADLRLDRPLVLGAFPAATRRKSVKTVLDTARSAGYGGALVWSVRAVDGRGGQDGQLAQWAKNHAAHLHRRPFRTEPPVAAAAPTLAPPLPAAASPARDIDEAEAEDRVRSSPADAEPSGRGLAAAPV
ncbi:MAG TPA: hypothetical protein VEJ89_15785 [Myxococcaceae bacterium]|jgi:hypothetical protein|nr:hypothetical protein [Myxococcaceae bacterium]